MKMLSLETLYRILNKSDEKYEQIEEYFGTNPSFEENVIKSTIVFKEKNLDEEKYWGFELYKNLDEIFISKEKYSYYDVRKKPSLMIEVFQLEYEVVSIKKWSLLNEGCL